MTYAQKNNALYHSLFNHLHSGVAVYQAINDGEDFILIDGNQALEEICNISKKQIVGKSILKSFPGVVEMGLFSAMQNVYRHGNAIHHPSSYYSDTNLSFWASNYIYKLETGEIVSIFDDITERKNTEQELKQFKILFDNAHFGHAIATSAGEITYVNNSFAQTHGYTRKELIGENISILHSSKQLKDVAEILNSFKEKGNFGPTDVAHIHKDGQELTMLMTGIVIKNDLNGENVFAISAIDISEQKKIKEDHLRLATAIQQTSDTIVITDKFATIQYVNPSFEKITGYSKDEAIGQNPRVLKSGTHSPEFYSNLWETISSGKVWKGRLCNKRKNGTLFTEDVRISPVLSPTGEIQNFVAVKHDITRELELEGQLLQAVKMEAIGTLAGGIAHDFNNLLAAINGFALMARDSIPEEHMAYKDLTEVLLAGDRAADLVKQILLFSRKHEPEIAPIKLSSLLKETHKMLRASLPANIDVILDVDQDCYKINADANQIHQVFMNLATNAAHAMEERGGTLSLFLANSEGSKEMEIPHIVFQVSDSGKGILPEELEKIFDPFYTNKAIGEGTGLGLAVVHGIIKNHNGIILVESEQFQGTTFTVRIPAIIQKKEHHKIPHLHERTGQGEHILIVDDEPAVGQLLERILRNAGYQTTLFQSSRRALMHFNENPANVDLLLTDMTMPDIDGSELAACLVREKQDLPVIICTGHIGSFGRAGDAKTGLTDVLYKPVKKEQLIRSVNKALHG